MQHAFLMPTHIWDANVECAIHNIHTFNPHMSLILYDSSQQQLLKHTHTHTHAMWTTTSSGFAWGRIHNALLDYAMDNNNQYATITHIEADVRFVRPGFAQYLDNFQTYDSIFTHYEVPKIFLQHRWFTHEKREEAWDNWHNVGLTHLGHWGFWPFTTISHHTLSTLNTWLTNHAHLAEFIRCGNTNRMKALLETPLPINDELIFPSLLAHLQLSSTSHTMNCDYLRDSIITDAEHERAMTNPNVFACHKAYW